MLLLVPALLLQNLGVVLSISGSVAGSAVSYICPGASYLAVHGAEFKKLVHKNWPWGDPNTQGGCCISGGEALGRQFLCAVSDLS
jgi:hypothetical protein